MDLSAEEALGDDDLFYGSSRVHFARVPGAAVPFLAQRCAPDFSEAALRVTLSRAAPTDLGDGAAPVVTPGIPARELAFEGGGEGGSGGGGVGDDDAAAAALASWPALLSAGPLLKVTAAAAAAAAAADTGAALRGVASGVRSALVRDPSGGCWFRLKGCGNNDEGFVLRETAAAPASGDSAAAPAWRDVRGSAFAHTAARENYMVARLGAALEPQGIPGCNVALGSYVYGPPHCPLGEAEDELVPRCIVQRTRGDRRLGTHVLAGLELILPLLLDAGALGGEAGMRAPAPSGRGSGRGRRTRRAW